MKIICTWRDDSLPCIMFEHNNRQFSMWWTSPSLENKLQMVADEDVTLEVALKRVPQLLFLINNPDKQQMLDKFDDVECEDEEEDQHERDAQGIDFTIDLNIGWVKVYKVGFDATES